MSSLKIHLATMNIVVNTEHKFLYTIVPKSGCTSILNSIIPTFDINVDTSIIHRELAKLSNNNLNVNNLMFLHKNKNYKEVRHILFSKQYYRFTCLRDPKSRLISAFFDKIIHPTTDIPFCYPFIKERNIEKSFINLLDCIGSLNPVKIDQHFRPQINLSLAGVIPYDKIFRLECLDQEYEILTKKFSKIKPVKKLNQSRDYEQLKKYLSKTFNDEIHIIYKEDYDYLKLK